VNKTSAPVNLFVNLRGESCNLTGTTPSRLLYNYTNNTDQAATTELIYLYSYDNSTPSAYTNATLSLFNSSNNMTAANIANLSFVVGTNLTASTYSGSRNFLAVFGETRFPTIGAPKYNNSVISSNFSVTANTIIYWAITIQSGPKVTAESLLNCGDTNLTKIFYNCGRAILAAGQTIQINATNVTSAPGYDIYMVATNEFVPRPIAGTPL
jgi:hypothetical protein